MTDRKLVSVVTGTYQRHELLLGAIENVRAQTYRPLEHVIVADGPDHDLSAMKGPTSDVPIIFQELGFWSSGLLTDSISAAPFMVAQLLARGEYQITMSDDERFLDPDAITKLVDALEAYDVDFAYSQAEITFAWNNPPYVIGTNPPQAGQITQFLYKREMLDKGMLFRVQIGNATDWDAVSRAMKAHARWVFVPEVLVTHCAHK
jgi:glycosyltransferase involved in cell wall biosynthesis